MLVKRRKIWHYQTKINGKSWSRSTGETDKRRAEPKAKEIAAIAALLKKRPDASRQLSGAIMAEVERLESDVSDGQAERVGYALGNVLTRIGDRSLDRITFDMIEDYQRQRLAEVSRSTVDKELAYLLRVLYRAGYNIPKPSPKAGTQKRVRPFTDEETARFFDACPDRWLTIYATLYATGARLGDIVPSYRSSHTALLKSEVDVKNRLITIRNSKRRATDDLDDGRQRRIPDWLAPLLETQIQCTDGKYVFKPLANSARDFDVILKRAGIQKQDERGRVLLAHSFRHRWMTEVSRQIANPLEMAAVAGHKKIQTTMGYTHHEAVAVPDMPPPWAKKHPDPADQGVHTGCTVVQVRKPNAP
jgi:integrase